MRLLAILLLAPLVSALSVTTQGYNNYRNNSNTSETVLTRAAVAGRFGQICSMPVDGAVYAQPLIVQGIGGRTLVIVATMHDSLYAFDSISCAQVWMTNLATSFTAFVSDTYQNFPNGEIGCTATPVISVSLGAVFEECLNSSNVHKLYSLNLADGSAYHSAVTIAGTVNSVVFTSNLQSSRASLLLLGSDVYTAFAGVGNENNPWNGWLIGYNSTTLAQDYLWCSTCAGNLNSGGGIWMSSGGIAADSGNNIFIVTGNGDWVAGSEYGESFVKLNSSLSPQDYFTPTDWATRNMSDTDLGSSRAMLLNDNYVVGAGKDGAVWVLATSSMGHLQSGGVGPVQTWTPTNNGDVRNYFAYDPIGATLFIGSAGADAADDTHAIKAYSWGGSSFNTTPAATSIDTTAYGFALSYSSNGASDGIVWTTTAPTSGFDLLVAGTLRALRSDTLTEIWNSGVTLGNISKFGMPVVANGRVYCPSSSNQVQVYGVLPSGRTQ